MKVRRFNIKDDRIPLVITTDDHKVIDMNLTRKAAKKLYEELGKGLAEFDN